MTSLRQRLLEDMQIRNLSPLTQRAYVEHVSRFARHFDPRWCWAPRRFDPRPNASATRRSPPPALRAGARPDGW